MQRETMVGIAWAVGLFAAMAAVFVYEAATFELDEFHVAWDEVAMEDDATGTLNAGARASHDFTVVDGLNITYVEVILTWTDANGGDDQFTLAVDGPNGTKQATGTNGRIALRFDGMMAPSQEHMKGVDEAHAKATSLEAPHNVTALVGDWNIQVNLDSAPPVATTGPAGTPSPTGCGVATNPACDGSNTYSVTWRVVSYKAVFPADDEAHEA